MTTGLSGAFAFNGTNFNQIPTTHGWQERTQYGVDASAHPVYSQIKSYEMTWNLISTENAKQIIDFYNLVISTGTLVACLPEWNNIEYSFYNYSGTTLQEPTFGGYFQGYLEDFRLLILNIVVTS